MVYLGVLSGFLVIKIGQIRNVNAMKEGGGGDGALAMLEKLDIRVKTR
jgi:hypothetical protein